MTFKIIKKTDEVAVLQLNCDLTDAMDYIGQSWLRTNYSPWQIKSVKFESNPVGPITVTVHFFVL